MTNAVVMPPVLKLNRAEIEVRIGEAANYLGIKGGFDGFFDYVLNLRRELSVPDTLGDMGIGTDKIEELVEGALKDPSCGGNPVVLTAENTRQLLMDSILLRNS
jgi:alcohol dehydrogenase class IV